MIRRSVIQTRSKSNPNSSSTYLAFGPETIFLTKLGILIRSFLASRSGQEEPSVAGCAAVLEQAVPLFYFILLAQVVMSPHQDYQWVETTIDSCIVLSRQSLLLLRLGKLKDRKEEEKRYSRRFLKKLCWPESGEVLVVVPLGKDTPYKYIECTSGNFGYLFSSTSPFYLFYISFFLLSFAGN